MELRRFASKPQFETPKLSGTAARVSSLLPRAAVRASGCRACGVNHSETVESQALRRRSMLLGLTAAASVVTGPAHAEETSESVPRIGEVKHSEDEWKAILPSGAYNVLRKGGTELPLSSPLYREKRTGTYKCRGCDAPLFTSQTKFESGTGWPSFTEALDNSVVELIDYSIPFYPRTEVRCKKCGGHIGHVFPDGPPPTGQRYCMNGAAMAFAPKA